MDEVVPTSFCPYKGLQPYTEADRKYFFGRDRDINIIISNLYAASVTVFYGSSGVGKSSVLLAGVVPRLMRDPRSAVIVVFNRWQNENFLAELKDAVITQSGAKEIDMAAPLDKFLISVQRALDLPLFLVCDQFEEYFLYHPPSNAAENFESAFSRSINSRNVQVNFMLSLREDGLSKLDRFQGRIPTLLNNMLRLSHLDTQAARDATTKPIDAYNEEHPNSQMSLEPGLVDAVLADLSTIKVVSGESGQGEVATQSASTPIETPFLQVVLTRLWDEEVSQHSSVLRLETFERLGRAENIALTHLDTTMLKLNDQERGTAANLLRYLVTPAGTKIAQEAGALASWSELPEGEVGGILTRLSAPDVRILRVVQFPKQPTRYEIFHDVLAHAILDWRARYVQAEKAKETERELEAERARAAAKIEKQAKRTKRLRYVIACLLLIGIVIIYLGVKARQGRFLAYARELAAYSRSEIKTDPEVSLLLAMEAVKQKQTPQSVAALREALISSHVSAVLADGHSEAIRAVAFSPDGKYVATASWDKTAVVWDSANGKKLNVLTGSDREVNSVHFSNDGRYLVTGSLDGNARVWENWQASTAHIVATLSESREIWTAIFSPDGQHIATGGASGKVTVWDWRQNKRDAELVLGISATPTPSPSPSDAADALPGVTAPDGTVVPSAPAPAATPGRIIHVFKAVFDPDGNHIIVAAKDRTVLVWTWREPTSIDNPVKLRFHRDSVYDAAFSPDGKYVVTASNDKTAAVWEWKDQAQLKRPSAVLNLLPHTIRGVSFSPDGQYVVTASDDGVARIWKWHASGKAEDKADATEELRGHSAIVFSTAFSRDGRFVVTGSEDHTARIWRTEQLDPKYLDTLSANDLLRLASTRVTRTLTADERHRYLD